MTSRKKKSLIVLLIFGLLFSSIHALFTFQSKAVLNELVKRLSKGRYQVDTDDLKISYFPLGIHVRKFRMEPLIDSAAVHSAVCEELVLEIQSVSDLIFRNRLDLKRLNAVNPDITLNVGRKKNRDKTAGSIAEMQQGLFNIFDLLKAEEVTLSDGSFRINEDADTSRYFSLNHIYLSLKDFRLENAGNSLADPFRGKASFELRKPQIHLPDSALAVRLDDLKLNKETGKLQIDSLVLLIKDDEIQDAGIQLASITVDGFDWSKFLEHGNIDVDSVEVLSGVTSLNLSKNRPIKTGKSAKRRYHGNPILIRHLSVNDISYSLLLKEYIRKNNDKVMMRIVGNKLEITDLRIVPEQTPALSVREIDVQLKDYSENDSRDLYNVALGSIKWGNNNLVLTNYELTPSQGSKATMDNKIQVPEFRVEQLSLADLLTKRVTAKRVAVLRPEIVLDRPEKSKSKAGLKRTPDESVRQLMESLQDKINIDQLIIDNGSIRLQATDSTNEDIVIAGIALRMDGKKTVAQKDLYGLFQCIDEFRTGGFTIRGPQIDLHVDAFRWLPAKVGIRLDHVKGRLGRGIDVDLFGMEILFKKNVGGFTESLLSAASIRVEKGNLSMKGEERKKKSVIQTPLLSADVVDLKNILVTYNSQSSMTVTSTLNIVLNGFSITNQQASWDFLKIDGLKNVFSNTNTSIEAADFSMEQPGVIVFHVVKGSSIRHPQKFEFSADELRIQTSLKNTRINPLQVTEISMMHPKIFLTLSQASKDTSAKSVLPNGFSIARLKMSDPEVHVSMLDSSGSVSSASRSLKGLLVLDSIFIDRSANHPALCVKSATYDGHELSSSFREKGITAAGVSLSLHDFRYEPLSRSVSCQVEQLRVNGFRHRIIGNKQDTLDIHLGEFSTYHYNYKSGNIPDWKKLLEDQPWTIFNGDITYSQPKSTLFVGGISVRHSLAYDLEFDSMCFANNGEREDYWKSAPFEKDFMRITAGHGKSQGLTIDWSGKTPYFAMQHLVLDQIHIMTERDKTRPLDTVAYRPLLARSISKLPMPLAIDTFSINDGSVRYHEIGQKSGKEGKLLLDHLNGAIYNIRNRDISSEDSLIVRLNGSLYGNGAFRLNFRQSYTDTLQGFWMRIRMAKFEMARMNELLDPIMNIRMKSGVVDTLTILVKGNDYFSYGTIDMRYHDLAVRIMNKKEKGGNFLNNTLNFLVNQFIRSSDNGKPNLLFRRRVRSKGQFNYWGKISVEGLLSNTGIKRDIAERKAFEKTLKAYELPYDYWSEE